MRFRFLIALFCLTLIFEKSALGAECSSLPSYDGSQPIKKNEVTIAILSADSKPSSPTLIISLLLADHLALASSLHPLPVMIQGPLNQKAQEEVDYQLQVSTQPGPPPGYRVEAILTPQVPKKEAPPVRFEGSFLLPQTMNEVAFSLSEKIAASLQSSLKEKKVLPYIYHTPSSEAALNYAQGRFLIETLDPLTREKANEAVQYFDRAIKSDYNYVYAYLGLAESLAALGNMTSNDQMIRRSDTEVMKAEILNPPMSKLKKGRIQWYRKQSCNLPK